MSTVPLARALMALIVVTAFLATACRGPDQQVQTTREAFPIIQPLPTVTAEPGMRMDPRSVVTLTAGGSYSYDNVTLRLDSAATGVKAVINTQTLLMVITEINNVDGDQKNIPTLVITFQPGLGKAPQYTAGDIGQGVIDTSHRPDEISSQIVTILYSAAHGNDAADEASALTISLAARCVSQEAYKQPGMTQAQLMEYTTLLQFLCFDGAPPIVDMQPT